jgi:hypothetical protein
MPYVLPNFSHARRMVIRIHVRNGADFTKISLAFENRFLCLGGAVYGGRLVVGYGFNDFLLISILYQLIGLMEISLANFRPAGKSLRS